MDRENTPKDRYKDISPPLLQKYDMTTLLLPGEWDTISGETIRDFSDIFPEDLKKPEIGMLVQALEKSGFADVRIERVLDRFFANRESNLYDATRKKAAELEKMIYTLKDRIRTGDYSVDEILLLPGTENNFKELPKEHKEYGKPEFLRYKTEVKKGSMTITVQYNKVIKDQRGNNIEYSRREDTLLTIRLNEEKTVELQPTNIKEKVKSLILRKRKTEVVPAGITLGFSGYSTTSPQEFLANHAAKMQSQEKGNHEVIAIALNNLQHVLFKDLDEAVRCIEELTFGTTRTEPRLG